MVRKYSYAEFIHLIKLTANVFAFQICAFCFYIHIKLFHLLFVNFSVADAECVRLNSL